jgi:hypothetical protein
MRYELSPSRRITGLALSVAGVLRSCPASEYARPVLTEKCSCIARGRSGGGAAGRCADDRPIHLWTSVPGGLYAEGLCGQHKNAELFTLSRQEVEARRRPVVDSRGLYWDENWRGGSWRAG